MKVVSVLKSSKFNKLMILSILAVMAVFTIAFAAEEVAPGNGDESAVVEEIALIEVPDATEGSEIEFDGAAIQSISFAKDMTIRDALRFLALKYQKNIVPTSKVDGAITVTNLYDVTFDEALQAIIGTNKFEVQGIFIKR